jgi:antitoxin component YwqK of YwqJK toxin-antitoxin module
MGFGSTVALAAIAWAAALSSPPAPVEARIASAPVTVAEDPALPADWEPVREYRGAAVDTIRENFPNGRARRVACYLAGRRDALAQHGPEWTWWPNGALQGRRFLVQGKQDGPSISYYESGVIESRGEFLEDGRHGQWNFFNEQGVLKAIRNYDHGEPHGQFLTLFANGTPKLEAEFEHGLQTGVEREWSIDGEVVREAHFRAGKLDGPLERIEILAKRPVEPGAAPEDADAIRRSAVSRTTRKG